jgi:predicted DNA-binding transcriptional regulator AlpA
MNRELITVTEFLVRYSISRTEFYRQVNAGRIRLTKLGNASRVSQSDANSWLASLPTVGSVLVDA